MAGLDPAIAVSALSRTLETRGPLDLPGWRVVPGLDEGERVETHLFPAEPQPLEGDARAIAVREREMRAPLKIALLALISGTMPGISGCAGDTEETTGKVCPFVDAEPFTTGQPFRISDPRSQLELSLQSDGRHMEAIMPDRKILWHRNLFDDPKLRYVFVPPVELKGEPRVSPEEWDRQVSSIISHLRIDRIAVEPECALRFEHNMVPPRFRGHTILVGSGTYIFWLLDPRTGDLQFEAIN